MQFCADTLLDDAEDRLQKQQPPDPVGLKTTISTIVEYPGQGGPRRARVELEITNTSEFQF